MFDELTSLILNKKFLPPTIEKEEFENWMDVMKETMESFTSSDIPRKQVKRVFAF